MYEMYVFLEDCVGSDDFVRIFNGGVEIDPAWPSFFTSVVRCQATNKPITVTATDIPFTIRKILFRQDLLTFILEYKIQGSDDWFRYPSTYLTKKPSYGWGGYVRFYTYEFKTDLEAYVINVIPETVTNNAATFCFQMNILGCHLPIPPLISFNVPASTTVSLELPFQQFSKQFDCSVAFTPKYYKFLKIIDNYKNEKVPEDSSSNVFSRVLLENDSKPDGVSTISLLIQMTALEQLLANFICFERNGRVYCHNHFSCIGATWTIDGIDYGHWSSDSLSIVFDFDADGCKYASCHINATCINKLGSYYCQCNQPLFGDGSICYEKNYWVEKKLGVFPTANYTQLSPSEVYCRVLFYANKTDVLYVCAQDGAESAYGCLASFDMGVTWETTHPHMDTIFGEDMNTGKVYGYSSRHYAYILYNPSVKKWICISDVHFNRIALLSSYISSRIVVPQCTYNLTRNDVMYPLDQSQYLVKDKLFAVTSKGISLKGGGEWKIVLAWNKLPLGYKNIWNDF